MKLISWNVNGLRAVHKKGFLDWFNAQQPDILCLQETKARQEQLPDELVRMPGYYSSFCSAEKKGYSGVCIYSKTEPASVYRGFNIEKFDTEGRILIAEYPQFTLFNIYYPNGGRSVERLNYKLEFYDAFLEYVNKLKDSGRNIVICGDINTAHKEIDLARPKENVNTSGFMAVEREWMDKFIASGYIDTFREFNSEPGNYTYWDTITRARERNVGWRIDYFFISESLRPNLKSAFIQQDVMGSDHCPLGIELQF